MKKLKKYALIASVSALLVPATVFAANAASCCGDFICCLLQAGCCN